KTTARDVRINAFMKCLLDEMWRKIGAGFEMGYKKQYIDATGGLQKQEGEGDFARARQKFPLRRRPPSLTFCGGHRDENRKKRFFDRRSGPGSGLY
ncbi:MAG: hypothetical protein WAV08_15875, partial [Desulfobacterales bacterium]